MVFEQYPAFRHGLSALLQSALIGLDFGLLLDKLILLAIILDNLEKDCRPHDSLCLLAFRPQNFADAERRVNVYTAEKKDINSRSVMYGLAETASRR